MRLTYCYALLLLLFACAEASTPVSPPLGSSHTLLPGAWEFQFDLGDGDTLHQYVHVDQLLNCTFYNGEEEIKAGTITNEGDHLYLEMPIYHTYFSGQRIDSASFQGQWHNPDRGTYSIPFSAVYLGNESRHFLENTSSFSYRVFFSPETNDEYPAIARFSIDGNHMVGTFETETGDYRYLAGQTDGQNATLQCFDGSHAFLFDMIMEGDSLRGTFKSGIHWKEPFIGVIDDAATLRNPFEITTLINDQSIAFHATALNGEVHHFEEDQFHGKVTILQLFGSWCPNCLDESRYFIELYARYHDQGLDILPLAFERASDFNSNALRLSTYQSELGIPYEIYLGGNAKKSSAEELFPMLSSVTSFPTSLIIDHHGKIRLIHTGFYGPGTGINYDHYRNTTETLIEELLLEMQQ